MKLYNTLTRKLETFKPQNPQNVKIYSCGPTVYDYAHIGNITSYIYWDLLIRTLLLHDYQVNRIIVLTDVGHLTSDADEGEDKLEKGAKREGKTVWQIAEHYTNNFLQNYQKLNLIPPQKFCKATDYITANQDIVTTLLKKNYAYETSDGIYFDTSKFPTYADFAKLDLSHLKAGARIEYSSEKHNPSDFALWKFIKPGELHAMRWDFLDKPGYPGWHIECSAIIHQELGETIDLHTGGIDHIPVHHTNEIAQTEATFGRKLSRFWLHNNFITIDGQKISKSLGNTYRLEDLEKRGFSAMDFKLWVLQGHFQSERNFSFADLTAAQHRHLRWRNQIAKLYQTQVPADSPSLSDQLLTLVSNNLNSAEAFSLIDNSTPDLATWEFIDRLFGLNLVKSSPNITPEQQNILKNRATARAQKNYDTSDRLRAELEQQGITVLDTPSGQIWQYLR